MTFANQGPQHSRQGFSRSSPSHNRTFELTPAEQKEAQEKARLEQEKKEYYAAERAKGIFHPSDPQTKIINVTDPAQMYMSRAEQERRIKDGTLPPEFATLHALIELRKDPANQRPPVEARGVRGPSPQTESPQGAQKATQKNALEQQPTFSQNHQRWQLSGSKAGETITVTQDPKRPAWYSVQIETQGKVTGSGSISAEELNQLDLHGGDGRDVIALIGQMPEGMRVYGDAGQDTILKTEGNEKQFIDGGKGVDRVLTATQTTNQAEFALTPETPVQQFQRELKENARNALQSNRDRLKSQEQRYQDPNPNSPQWKALWNAASTRAVLDQKAKSLHQEQEQVKAALAKPDALPKQSRLTVPEAAYRQDPAAQRYERLSERRAAIPRELEQLKQSRLELEYEFPALSAVGQESKNTRENNQAILGRIPQKFGEIRHSIDDLDHQIQNDPKVALRLDKVVEQTLAAGVSFDQDNGQREVTQVNEWLKAEGFWKHAVTGAGIAATGVAGVASLLNPEVGLLGWGAAALGFGTAAAQLPDMWIDDRAAQSQRGGAQPVTSLDPDTARGNLVLGGVNLVLAGLDVGLQPEVLRGLVKIPGIARAGLALTNQQRRVLMASVGRIKGEVTDAIVQKLTAAVQHGAIEVELPGVGKVKLNELETQKPMQMKGTVRDSSRITVPNPNVSPAMLEQWSKTRNWKDVEPWIGQQVGDTLPPGYQPRTRKGHFEIVRKTQNNEEMVPLQVSEDGTFQITTKVSNRISNPFVMKKNFEAAYGKLRSGYWIHHLIPDEVMRRNALAKFSQQISYNLDRASNLEGLAAKEEWARIRTGQAEAPTGGGYSDKVGHWSSHDEYSRQVNVYLNAEFKTLEREFGNLNQAIKDPKKKKQLIQEVNQAMENAENEFRNRIRKGNVPHTPDGRMTWNNEQTEPIA